MVGDWVREALACSEVCHPFGVGAAKGGQCSHVARCRYFYNNSRGPSAEGEKGKQETTQVPRTYVSSLRTHLPSWRLARVHLGQGQYGGNGHQTPQKPRTQDLWGFAEVVRKVEEGEGSGGPRGLLGKVDRGGGAFNPDAEHNSSRHC